MSTQPIDYNALAAQARQAAPVDYTALAEQARHSAAVPGMERLGALPSAGKRPTDPVLKADKEDQLNQQLVNESSPIAGAMGYHGATQVGQGVEQMAGTGPGVKDPATGKYKYPGTTARDVAGGASKVIRGAGEIAAPMLLPLSAAAAPLATATSLATGYAASKGTGAALDAAGVPPEYSDLASDAAGIAGGGVGARLGGMNAIPAAKNAIRNLPNNVNNPVQESALQYAESKDVPISVGQRSGNAGLQRVEQGLENVPGSGAKAQTFYKDQQDALARVGNDEAAKVSPTSTNPYGAGQGVQQALQSRIAASKGQADNFYDQVRQAAAANQQVKQVGTKASAVLGPDGQPVQTPVTQSFETPVDLAPFQQSLQPIYDDIAATMPVSQQQASPAFAVLKNIMARDMAGPERYMNAVDFDKSLGAIKSIAREGQNPYLTSRSQGVAKEIVRNGEQQLSQALSGAGPQVQAKLQAARSAVQDYHGTADLLNSLNDEPSALYSNLVTGGDKSYTTLAKLSQIAPGEVQTMGRTFLQGMLDTATREGGFGKAQTVMGQWDRMGPQTKQLLFGKQAPDIDNFVMAAKTLTKNANPSGTAKMMTALGSLGAAGEALGHIITGGSAGLGAAAGVGVGMAGSRLAAELLLTPGMARSVANTIPKFSGPGAAAGAAATGMANTDRIFPKEQLPEFSQQHQMTIDQAKRELEMQGYKIQ